MDGFACRVGIGVLQHSGRMGERSDGASEEPAEAIPLGERRSSHVMPNQKASMAKLSGAKFYGSLDMVQGYWQLPLAPEAQELFTIASDCSPTPVFRKRDLQRYVVLPGT